MISNYVYDDATHIAFLRYFLPVLFTLDAAYTYIAYKEVFLALACLLNW